MRRATWMLAAALLAGAATLDAVRASPVDVVTPDLPLTSPVDVREPETPRGPCTLVRKVGSHPAPDTDPLLGMFEVDPDHCVEREIQRLLGSSLA